jgi:hypothetical protein
MVKKQNAVGLILADAYLKGRGYTGKIVPRKKYNALGADLDGKAYSVTINEGVNFLDHILGLSDLSSAMIFPDLSFPLVCTAEINHLNSFYRAGLITPPYVDFISPGMVIPDAKVFKYDAINQYFESQSLGHIISVRKKKVEEKFRSAWLPLHFVYQIKVNGIDIYEGRTILTGSLVNIINEQDKKNRNYTSLSHIEKSADVWWKNLEYFKRQ